MKKLTLCLSLLIGMPLHLQALDQEITVLGVSSGGANVSRATTQLQYLKDHWPLRGILPIKLANGGVPISLGLGVQTGSAPTQLAQGNVEWEKSNWGGTAMSLRDFYAADVVILFTGSMTDSMGLRCGYAGSPNIKEALINSH